MSMPGCDSVSSFAGKGKVKVKAVDLIRKNEQFKDKFVLLGQQWCVSVFQINCLMP